MLRPSASAGAATLAVTLVCLSPQTRAQEEKGEPLADATTEGVLDRVVTDEEGIIVRTDDGQLMGWELPAPAVAEAAKFPAGTRVWVIYRGEDAEDRAVTALGFPGEGSEPVYVNATGYDVLLRATGAVGGRCGGESEHVTELPIFKGLSVPVSGDCWCCAMNGETCRPSNHSRNGRIVLAQCFGRPAP
jgi:hypothetical protein